MQLGDREFTSEEVADLCGVTRVTVADWISRGRLAVRWTSGGHRRIPRASLAAFMLEQGDLLPRSVESPRALTLVLDHDGERRNALAALFGGSVDFEVESCEPGIDALLSIGARRPDVLAFATRIPGFDTPQFITAVRGIPLMAE
jgi:excisionase family DNA binding protein